MVASPNGETKAKDLDKDDAKARLAAAAAHTAAKDLDKDEPAAAPGQPKAIEAQGQPKAKKQISTADKIKFGGLIVFFLLIIAASVLIVMFINSLGSESLEVELQRAIKDAGVFGILICLGLQFLQVVVAFIPGEVVQIAIGYVYGTVAGGFITLFGALISSIFVFYLVRKLGAPFVQGMIGDKDSKRIGFLQNSKNLNSLVLILYLIPGLPKDLFNYIFPLTKIRPSAFFILSTVARAPAIFASTFVASAFKNGEYLQMAIVIVIAGGMALLGIIFNQRIMEFVDRLVSRIAPRKQAAAAATGAGVGAAADVDADAAAGAKEDVDANAAASADKDVDANAFAKTDKAVAPSAAAATDRAATTHTVQKKTEED